MGGPPPITPGGFTVPTTKSAAPRGEDSSRQRQLWLLLGIMGVVMLATGLAVVIIASGVVSQRRGDAEGSAEMAPMQGKLVVQQASGSLYFTADDAVIHGDTARVETVAGRSAVTRWTSPSDWLSWDFRVEQPAVFRVEVIYATPPASGGKFSVAIRDAKKEASVRESGGAQTFMPHEIGFLTVRRSGRHQLTMRVVRKPAGQLMILRAIQLTPHDVGHVRS
jgi:hypothetical protein